MQIFMRIYEGQSSNKCITVTLLISYVLKSIKNGGPVLKFPKFDVSNAFSQIQEAPGPNFRKVGKSLLVTMLLTSVYCNTGYRLLCTIVFLIHQKGVFLMKWLILYSEVLSIILSVIKRGNYHVKYGRLLTFPSAAYWLRNNPS